MKWLWLLTILFAILFTSCSKNNVDPTPQPRVEDSLNNAPGSFIININGTSWDTALISWTAAIDPDNDPISYKIFLNDSLVVSNYKETNYILRKLKELTSYTVKIVASDSKNKESFATTQFKSTKYFFTFFRKIDYGNISSYGGGHSIGEMIKANDGGYILSGETSLIENGIESRTKFFLFKVDTAGNVLWRKYYNYEAFNIADLKIVSFMNGYILGAGRNILRVDNQGNELWHKPSAYKDEIILGIGAGKSGEFYTTGKVTSPDPTKEMSASLSKYDASGSIVWNKLFTPTNWNEFSDVIETNSNQLMVLGQLDPKNKNREEKSNNRGEDGSNFWLINLTTDGDLIWDKGFDEPGYAFPKKVIQTSDGNFVIAGFSMTRVMPMFMAKVDGNGNKLWTFFDETLTITANSVAETEDHSLIVTGCFQTTWTFFHSLVKFNSLGQKLWEQDYKEFNTILKPKTVIPVNDGGYLINCERVGIYNSSGEFDQIYLFKTDENGVFN